MKAIFFFLSFILTGLSLSGQPISLNPENPHYFLYQGGEHYYNKLIDLKVIKSMWGKDTERGQIQNVTFHNIEVAQSIYNPGYSMSLIGGYDSSHTVENVLFDHFRINGNRVNNADQLELYVKQAGKISFK